MSEFFMNSHQIYHGNIWHISGFINCRVNFDQKQEGVKESKKCKLWPILDHLGPPGIKPDPINIKLGKIVHHYPIYTKLLGLSRRSQL